MCGPVPGRELGIAQAEANPATTSQIEERLHVRIRHFPFVKPVRIRQIRKINTREKGGQGKLREDCKVTSVVCGPVEQPHHALHRTLAWFACIDGAHLRRCYP